MLAGSAGTAASIDATVDVPNSDSAVAAATDVFANAASLVAVVTAVV
jgi:hypothetical protein